MAGQVKRSLVWDPKTHNQSIAHVASLSSFYKAYPLAKRPDSIDIPTNSRVVHLSNKVLPTVHQNEPPLDPSRYHHLQDYLNNVKRGDTLRDGVEGIQVGTIAAIQGERVNGQPWFGKVTKVMEKDLEVVWMYKKRTKYYYQSNSPTVVSKEAVICNGVEFEPSYGNGLQWRLLTPLPFIQSMNSEEVPTLEPPIACTVATIRQRKLDVSLLMFDNEREFLSFLEDY